MTIYAQDPPTKTYFKAEDFSQDPPEDCGLDEYAYSKYVKAHVGKEIPAQDISQEALAREGWSDWKEYCILSPMMYWG